MKVSKLLHDNLYCDNMKLMLNRAIMRDCGNMPYVHNLIKFCFMLGKRHGDDDHTAIKHNGRYNQKHADNEMGFLMHGTVQKAE